MRDVDQIMQSIMKVCPTVKVRQLKVANPGTDDDGVWFFEQPGDRGQPDPRDLFFRAAPPNQVQAP